MFNFLHPGAPVWPLVTHLGSAGFALPLLLIAALTLRQCRQPVALRRWLLSLTLAAFLTLVSKILFLGWGIGIAGLDFTGASGHALLAGALLPVLCGWLWPPLAGAFSRTGAAVGLLLALLVDVSRVVLGAHSISEVVVGGVAGLAVSAIALACLMDSARRPRLARLSVLLLILALGGNVVLHLPTHDWETRLALLLADRDQPYRRHF